MGTGFDPDEHHRRSIRLPDYDYSQPGAYFVTVATQDRMCLFGDVENGAMETNDAGRMIERWLAELATRFRSIRPVEFVVMPNHVHGIVLNEGTDLHIRPGSDLAEHPPSVGEVEQRQTGPPLHKVVQWFKTMTTNEYIRGVKDRAWAPFPGRMWQRNYYEHVIRDEDDPAAVREYIAYNPAKWAEDAENPNKV